MTGQQARSFRRPQVSLHSSYELTLFKQPWITLIRECSVKCIAGRTASIRVLPACSRQEASYPGAAGTFGPRPGQVLQRPRLWGGTKVETLWRGAQSFLQIRFHRQKEEGFAMTPLKKNTRSLLRIIEQLSVVPSHHAVGQPQIPPTVPPPRRQTACPRPHGAVLLLCPQMTRTLTLPLSLWRGSRFGGAVFAKSQTSHVCSGFTLRSSIRSDLAI